MASAGRTGPLISVPRLPAVVRRRAHGPVARPAYPLAVRRPRARSAGTAALDLRRVRMVVPGVAQVRVQLSGVFLLLDERVTLVDTGPPGSAWRVLSALRGLGRSADEVEQIVITHYHVDHAGGLAALLEHVPARVGVHVVEAPYIRGEKPIPAPFSRAALRALAAPAGKLLRPPPARVDTLLRDGDELPVLGGMRVIATPGHTRGHISLHVPARGLLIAGDALQVRDGDRLVGPAPLVTEDYTEALRSLRRLTGIDFEVLALSHFTPQRGDVRERLSRLAWGT